MDRPALVELLRSGHGRKLTLLSAPTGSGKTTLLTQWRASWEETRRFAWISLDGADNDPARLCAYLIEAVDRVEPGFGDHTRGLLGAPETDFGGLVLPEVVNALSSLPRRVVVVVDDYHLLDVDLRSNPIAYILNHKPETVQLVISTRSDPPMPLGRLRASGQMVEIRAADLAFNRVEAGALLSSTLGTELDRGDLDALLGRTEGWPAGVYLAALALRRSSNPGEDIRAFSGDARHLTDYLTEEVLQRQLPKVRNFFLKTSVLERFTAPLCDAVVGEEGSVELLGWLERSNLFVVPLDAHRGWYRYHHLFADLLRTELRGRDPAIIPELHRRAAAWYLASGAIEDAVRHTLASGDSRGAGQLIARHWPAFLDRGMEASLRSWMSSLPERDVAAYPPLAMVSAWLSSFDGDLAGMRRWVSAAEDGDHEGPMPDGTTSLEAEIALLRASFAPGNVAEAYEAARHAVELGARPESPWRAIPFVTLGCSLYWMDRAEESRRALLESMRIAEAAPMPASSRLVAMGLLAVLESDDGTHHRAAELAHEALGLAKECGLDDTTHAAGAHAALGAVAAAQGRAEEAAGHLERALALVWPMEEYPAYPHLLLGLAQARWELGHRAEARTLHDEARGVIEGYEDPGRLLLSELDRVGRRLVSVPRRPPEPGQGLTDQELEVLRLLASERARPEIAASLHVSVNTVKSHLRSIYRKLSVSSREDAVEAATLLGILS